MAENKTTPGKASASKYLDALPDVAQRADAKALVSLMEKVSGEKPVLWGPSIVGFGNYHYVYESGREGDMPLVCFSPRKAATVLYVTTQFAGAEGMLAKLGKHKLSGGCLHVKRLADVDIKILEKIVAKTLAANKAKDKS
jgi:hypothetical protein